MERFNAEAKELAAYPARAACSHCLDCSTKPQRAERHCVPDQPGCFCAAGHALVLSRRPRECAALLVSEFASAPCSLARQCGIASFASAWKFCCPSRGDAKRYRTSNFGFGERTDPVCRSLIAETAGPYAWTDRFRGALATASGFRRFGRTQFCTTEQQLRRQT